jgi:hypothetical protein
MVACISRSFSYYISAQKPQIEVLCVWRPIGGGAFPDFGWMPTEGLCCRNLITITITCHDNTLHFLIACRTFRGEGEEGYWRTATEDRASPSASFSGSLVNLLFMILGRTWAPIIAV